MNDTGETRAQGLWGQDSGSREGGATTLERREQTQDWKGHSQPQKRLAGHGEALQCAMQGSIREMIRTAFGDQPRQGQTSYGSPGELPLWLEHRQYWKSTRPREARRRKSWQSEEQPASQFKTLDG